MTDPAHSWVEHLRAGGTTPWLTWLANREKVEAEPGESSGRAGRNFPTSYDVLPGAAQLELVRRLAERAVPDPRFAHLADRALDRAGPGRGRSERPLVRPDAPAATTRTGVPPADPATLPADELIRPGIGLLADLLLAEAPSDPTSAPDHPDARRSRWPWRRRFHLAGAPGTVAAVRGSLAAAGHVEGGRRPEVVILAEPLDVHLAQVWASRVEHGAPVRWRTFMARWAHRDELPPSAQLTRIAGFWADRVGRDRVHVVTGTDPRRTTAAVLRLRDTAPTSVPTTAALPTLSPAVVDLLRRLNSVLNVRVGEEVRGRVRARAVALVRDLDPSGEVPISVPERHRAWLDARADTLADGLRRDGYAVHGDLDSIAPRHRGRSHPYRPDVLALVLDSCLALAGLRRERE